MRGSRGEVERPRALSALADAARPAGNDREECEESVFGAVEIYPPYYFRIQGNI